MVGDINFAQAVKSKGEFRLARAPCIPEVPNGTVLLTNDEVGEAVTVQVEKLGCSELPAPDLLVVLLRTSVYGNPCAVAPALEVNQTPVLATSHQVGNTIIIEIIKGGI